MASRSDYPRDDFMTPAMLFFPLIWSFGNLVIDLADSILRGRIDNCNKRRSISGTTCDEVTTAYFFVFSPLLLGRFTNSFLIEIDQAYMQYR